MLKKPLYLAKNLNDLHKLVKKSSNYGRKFEVLCRASDTLYNNAVDVKQKEPLDEEMLYVYCTRYLNLISTIKSQVNDDKFVNMRFAKSIIFIEDLQKQCDASLWERYKDTLEPIEVDNKHIEEAMADVVENNKSSLLKKIKDDDIFVTSHLFYDLITDERLKILVLDARADTDFKETRIKCKDILNIPSVIIKKGLTTNTIAQLMDEESRQLFEKRHSYDLVIMMDEDTNLISYRCSKLEDLRTILVEWDINQKYQILPLVLDGGLKIFCDFYPTQITNPGRVYNKTYTSFDDIFNEVYYPEEILQPTPKDSGLETESGQEEPQLLKLLKQMEALTIRELDIEKAWKNVSEGQRKALKVEQEELHNKLTYLGKELNALSEQGITDPQFQSLIDNLRDLENQVVKTRKENREDTELRPVINRDTKPQVRKNTLEPEPNTKPNTTAQSKSVITRPLIPDRRTKPMNLSVPVLINQLEQKFRHSGFRGLVNVKNTCYMNSIIQCLRVLPSVLCFFNNNVDFRNHSLTLKLGQTILSLWGTNNGTGRGLVPEELYSEICIRDPQQLGFSRGKHEDAHEFFMYLMTNMTNELQVPIISVNTELTGRAKDWLRNFKNMTCFFTTEFFHQLEFTTTCTKCNKLVVKYEYGNTIFLPLPPDNKTFRLQDAIDEYFKVVPTDDNKFCTSCESRIQHKKKVTYYPNILVINLVRYEYCLKEHTILRCSNRCMFTEDIFFGGMKYKLKSMSMHSGNRNFGHYTALAYHIFAKRWITYNDEDVYYCDNIHTNEIYKRTYVLFYTLDCKTNINETFFSPPDDGRETSGCHKKNL